MKIYLTKAKVYRQRHRVKETKHLIEERHSRSKMQPMQFGAKGVQKVKFFKRENSRLKQLYIMNKYRGSPGIGSSSKKPISQCRKHKR